LLPTTAFEKGLALIQPHLTLDVGGELAVLHVLHHHPHLLVEQVIDPRHLPECWVRLASATQSSVHAKKTVPRLGDKGRDGAHAVGEDNGADDSDEDGEEALEVRDRQDIPVAHRAASIQRS
jgi:hypothetical protein